MSEGPETPQSKYDVAISLLSRNEALASYLTDTFMLEGLKVFFFPCKQGEIAGEVPRGNAAAIVGTGERQAGRVISALIEQGVVTSESTRAPLHLAFPATLASRWMSGLSPERAS